MKKFVRIFATVLMVALVGVMAVACAPLNIDSAEDKMEKAGYLVLEEEFDKDENEDIAGIIDATSLTGKVTATLYRSTKAAKEAFEKLGGDKDSKNIKRSGRWVIVGTEKAIEDFLD